MKKSICIIISFLSILYTSCIEREERIIKDSCENIIRELDLSNLSNNLVPCLKATEKESDKDSVCYEIHSELYQKGVKPIEYTDYFIVSGYMCLFYRKTNKYILFQKKYKKNCIIGETVVGY